MGILRSITFQELALFIKHRQFNKREIASLALLSEASPCPSFFIPDRLKFIGGGEPQGGCSIPEVPQLHYLKFNCPLFSYWTWAMGAEKSRTERSSLGLHNSLHSYRPDNNLLRLSGLFAASLANDCCAPPAAPTRCWVAFLLLCSQADCQVSLACSPLPMLFIR